MKVLYLLLLSLCLVEIYGQRSRTTNTNQEPNNEELKPSSVRTRGRSRFSATEEVAQTPAEQPAIRTTTNRRASTRTRIHSNNPKAAADRRARPTEAPTRGYAVEEINNDSPIESFRRQSKSRVLSESRFEIPTVTVSRRPAPFEASTPVVDAISVEEIGFGSTARAILQARGEPLPSKTTTPVVDEEYLLTNFGSTIRSLAASSRGAPQTSFSRQPSRNDNGGQRATPLRSEVPILEQEEIPSRRSSLRGEPLPSLRGSNNVAAREPPIRSRNSSKSKLAEARGNPTRLESDRRATTTAATVVEDYVRANFEAEEPEEVQGLPEQSEQVTETQQQPFEIITEIVLPSDEEDVRKSPSVQEVTTPRSNYADTSPKRVVVNSRRSGFRSKSIDASEVSPAPRTRAPRTRPTRRPDESDFGTEASPSRVRANNRRRIDDAVVAESRYRGPSIFTAEQYQDVTTRSRTGRRIDSKYESVPDKITVEWVAATTPRARSSGRRSTTAGAITTERSIRGRSRSRGSQNEATSQRAPSSGSSRSSGRRSSYVEDNNNNVRRQGFGEDNNELSGRRPTSFDDFSSNARRLDNEDNGRRSSNPEATVYYGEKNNGNLVNRRHEAPAPRSTTTSSSSSRRVAPAVEAAPRRRGGAARFELPDDIANQQRLHNREQTSSSRSKATQTRSRNPTSRNTVNKYTEAVEETTIYYGEKSRRTDPPDTTIPPTTTTTTTEKPAIKNRSRSRFADAPPRIDESKLEVLPLFEREPKAVTLTRSRGHRSRSSVNRKPSEDHMHVSATENDVKFVEKPTTSAFTRVTVTRTESVEASTSRVRLSTRTAGTTTTEAPRRSSSSSSSSTSSSTVPTTRAFTTTSRAPVTVVPETTTTTTTTRRFVTRSPPVIKESVVAEINQVTSKSTITRRKKVPKAKAAEMLSRGSKKAELKSTDVAKKKSSAEEIDDEDNYPEPFKALIHAKKLQEETKPPQPPSRSATITKTTTTERVIVTSAGGPRGSSTARVVTTATVAARKPQKINEMVNDNENELVPLVSRITPTTPPSTIILPTRPRHHLPKFSEKPKYQQRQKEKLTRSTEKPPRQEKYTTTKATSTPGRKSYSTKSYTTRGSSEHHTRRKALRSTAFPPSTTPLNLVNREAKFSAKFIKKEANNPKSGTTDEKGVKSAVSSHHQPKGLYSSRKSSSDLGEDKVSRQLDVSLIQNAKPPHHQTFKKLNASRYSSRFRGDTSTRSTVLKSTTSAPFYIPTIPTPAYVPTIPTVTPPVTPVDGILAVKDGDLGVEVISFDDPLNTIPSADLVNGEYLTTDKNLKLSPMVKDGTTEKPVSIIERIINSITMISTTEAPNTTAINLASPSTTAASENSAILKLATKKSTTKDKTKPDVQTNIIETITSEKPTTIIEKIRSSLSAIQTNEVGTSDFSTVSSSSSTTPLSTVTKYSAKYRGSSVGTTALPAPQPLSTSISPLSVFDEIDTNQVLEKRTIGKLLNILNGLVSTENSEKLVVVTPKNLPTSAGFVATTFSPQEPIEAISLNGIESRASFSDLSSSNSVTTVNTGSKTTVNTTESSSIVNNNSTDGTTNADTTTAISTQSDLMSTETVSVTGNTEVSISEESSSTIPPTRSTETPTKTTDILSTTPQPLPTATVNDAIGSTLFTFPSTLPSIPTFEVESNRMTRLLSNERTSTDPLPRVVITSTTTSAPVSTNSVSSTTLSTTTMTTTSMPSTTAVGSTTTSSTTMLPLSTTTNLFTISTLLPSTITMQPSDDNTVAPNIVEIMAVPGETRISKSQTTTSTSAPSTVEASTAQEMFTSTLMAQSTETIPPTLGEILNGRTVDALNSLIKLEVPATKAPNYKTLQVNQYNEVLNIQDLINRNNGNVVYRWKPVTKTEYKNIKNSITSTTSSSPDSSTLTTAQSFETVTPFTSSILSTERAISTPNSSDRLINNTVDSSTITTAQSSESAEAPFTSVLKTDSFTQNSNIANRNLLTSTITDSSTITTTQPNDSEAPFTSSIFSTDRIIPNSSDRLLSSTLISTLMPASTTTTTAEPTTQRTTTTTTMRTTPPETRTTTRRVETTTRRLTTSATPKFTTGFPSFTPSTIFPTILTTFFPNFLRGATPENRISTTKRPLSSAEFSNSIGDRFEVLSASGSTARPTTVLPQLSTSQRISTSTTPTTTTTRSTTTRTTTTQPTTTTTTSTTTTTTTTTPKPSTTTTAKPKPTTTQPKVSQSGTPAPTTKEETDKLFDELKKSGKLKNLNEEQKKNLEEIERIEKEQAELLKQLSVLTTMFGGQNARTPNLPALPNPNVGMSSTLANRIINMAMARDRSRATTTDAPSTTTTRRSRSPTSKRPNSIQDQLPVTQVEVATKKTTPSLEDVLKQYNLDDLSTPQPLSSTYGKTDEALLAAILKEQGIGPTTPKVLADKVKEAGLFEEVPTTKKPKPRARPVATTTARPIGGRLMQGLNWLLDILDPPTTKKPAPRKAKAKNPKQNPADEELLTNQPTRITPMITAAPVTKPNLSQDEIQALIKQLEAVQDNPTAAGQLDFSKIKSLQNLINVNEGVQVTHTGQHGATSRATPRPPRVRSTTTERDLLLTEINRRKPKSSTASTLSVSNSIDDDDAEVTSTTVRNRFMPPVSLNPIPGIDDASQGDSLIRSNLLTAAVNVTRAISSFLGSALQGATRGFRSLIGSGSTMVGNIAQTSSAAAG